MQPYQPCWLVFFFSLYRSSMSNYVEAKKILLPSSSEQSGSDDVWTFILTDAAFKSADIQETLSKMDLNAMVAACYALPVLVSVLTVRFFYVLWHSDQPASRPRTTGLRCLIVLGSGGHTAEMMNIVTTLQKDRFTPRYYVAALTDNMSLQKAQVYEQSLIQVEVLGLGWSSIFYIESIARVKKLSLSGLLLYKLRIADQFFVQWPQLQHEYPRACYAGHLM
ncbi:unnamed protein product [Miscanthus lutarioriparius]|uniref:UDP-N-acetylglucosamine transferase subunit ALG14 n=1 Tax=Miscanthus lutarioriparius TaxID=422564 RepID=A0A811REM6_9POAL|nr:unnamed protein product [Miscanthus lutarioriparius]